MSAACPSSRQNAAAGNDNQAVATTSAANAGVTNCNSTGGRQEAGALIGAVVGGVIGFFVPDLLLLRSGAGTRSSALEALLVFVDLVTLERLANASAPQALLRAASLSQVPLFVQTGDKIEIDTRTNEYRKRV